ncbi:MAG: septal ring lytic transglycosylase RlpA family protein, partial [Nitrosomonadaceae bacterium]
MNNNFGFGNVLSPLSTIPTPASWLIVVIALIFLASCNTLGLDTSLQTSSSTVLKKGDKGGGYYLDDGPGDNPPPNLASIPNAIPRIEPLRKSNMRPYVVLGKTYTPMTALGPYKKRGIASWYGRRYHGKKTASGEIYDMYGMTAAHTTLPLPSYAQVTNIKNKKSVIVRINDR